MNREKLMLLAFEQIIEHSQDMIFVKDLDLTYIGASPSFAELVHYPDYKSMVGKTDFDFFPAELAERYTKDDRRLIRDGFPVLNYLEPIPDVDGKKRYSSTSKFVLHESNGSIAGICGIARDVTSEIELREEIERRELSRQMFEAIFEADITKNYMLRSEGGAYAQLVCDKENCLFTEFVDSMASAFIHPDYDQEFREHFSLDRLISEYRSGNKKSTHIFYDNADSSHYKWMEFTSRLHFSELTNTLHLTVFLRNLDDEITKKEQLRLIASTDSLTGILNRKSVIEKITECITGYGQELNHALLFLDLDQFKQANDTFGHIEGDNILKHTAQVLKSLFRKDDIIGRLGGDEFLILLKNIATAGEAVALTSKILNAPSYTHDGFQFRITYSIGITMYEGNGKSFEQLYYEADKAMYLAKRRGRSQIAVYEK